MKDYHINIFYSEEDGGYIADIPDLNAFARRAGADRLATGHYARVMPKNELSSSPPSLPQAARISTGTSTGGEGRGEGPASTTVGPEREAGRHHREH